MYINFGHDSSRIHASRGTNTSLYVAERVREAMKNKTLAAAESKGSTQNVNRVMRLRSLPETVRNFYYEKGLLYIGIKGINDWGRALHKGDTARANAYSLSILYRHAGKRKTWEAAAAGA